MVTMKTIVLLHKCKECQHPMKTRYWVIQQPEALEHHPAILEAAALLRDGEVIAFPTETVYGLGGDARSEDAIAKIFEAKGRPADNPLIVHLYDVSQLPEIVREVPEIATRLLDAFAPGPLTLIMHSNGSVAANVTAGLSSVAVRFPDHPVARALLQACGLPLAAPSANRSGSPSPTEATHVRADLEGRIAGIVDAGATGVGLESTVLDVTVSPPIILRPGAISIEQLQAVIGDVAMEPSISKQNNMEAQAIAPRSPGMKYRHYAPNAPVWIVDADGYEALYERMLTKVNALHADKKRIGILTTEEGKSYYLSQGIDPSIIIEVCGSRNELTTVAKNLYPCLRRFNEYELDIILAESFPDEGIGSAIMNRLEKAAGGRYV